MPLRRRHIFNPPGKVRYSGRGRGEEEVEEVVEDIKHAARSTPTWGKCYTRGPS